MANPGDIHLTGRPEWQPKAREIFKAACEKFVADYRDDPGVVSAYAQTVDLAEREFLETSDRAYARAGAVVFAEHFEREGPGMARLCLIDLVLNWNRASKRKGRK